MGRCQTETCYSPKVSYPKSVLIWLQEFWTGPTVHMYPLRPARRHRGTIPSEGRSLRRIDEAK